MIDLLTVLRTRTTALHEQLHVHPLLAPLQQASITLADYHWCLRAFDAAYHQIENANHYTRGAPLPAREWLQKDLQQHHLTPLALPVVNYPAIDTYSRQVGAQYVVQGSSLGGRVISKHLQQSLGLVEQQTNHFFAGFGSETGPRWKAFLAVLEDPDIDAQQAADQALHTFTLIAECCDAALAAKRSEPYSTAAG